MDPRMPFNPRRFQSAASHYAAGRPVYSPRLIHRLVQVAGLGRADRVMDLGCGPAPLAIALAPFAGAVTAIDPEPEMLRLGAANAARAGVEVTFVEGSSYDLGPRLGRFRLVVIGRAFHWMDRTDTLKRLDELIEPEGMVALCHSSHPELPENAWRSAYDAVTDRYKARDADRVKRKSPEWPRDETILLQSAFNRLERISAIEQRQTPVERFVDRALSMSSTTPMNLGAASSELAEQVRAALAPFASGGGIVEIVESEALIASRPGPADIGPPAS
jgi:ubiquinone/menaquinone biosynthesis C-methylase UbiE